MINLNNSENYPPIRNLVPASRSTSKLLRWNLLVGSDISGYVNHTIYYSSNNPNTPGMKAKIETLKKTYHYANRYIREFVEEVDLQLGQVFYMNNSLNEWGNQKKVVLMRAQNAEDYHMGNCHEMSMVGFAYACRNRIPQRVEIFFIKGGNHVFIVIGRRYNSDPKNPHTWGRSAVICDSWAQKVYPASEVESKMENLVRSWFDEITGEIFYELEPYNPMKHEFCERYPNALHPDIGIL